MVKVKEFNGLGTECGINRKTIRRLFRNQNLGSNTKILELETTLEILNEKTKGHKRL